jgi:hypothetical protein
MVTRTQSSAWKVVQSLRCSKEVTLAPSAKGADVLIHIAWPVVAAASVCGVQWVPPFPRATVLMQLSVVLVQAWSGQVLVP